MRGWPIKPHTSARRALPLPCVRHTLWLLFNTVDVPLHDGCRLRDFLALLELPALLPDLLIDLRKLFIEIRFFCQQGFAWNAASIQNLFCIVIFCFSRFKSGEGSFCCQRVKELLVYFGCGRYGCGFGFGVKAGFLPASICSRLPRMACSIRSSEKSGFLRSGHMKCSCPRNRKPRRLP